MAHVEAGQLYRAEHHTVGQNAQNSYTKIISWLVRL